MVNQFCAPALWYAAPWILCRRVSQRAYQRARLETVCTGHVQGSRLLIYRVFACSAGSWPWCSWRTTATPKQQAECIAGDQAQLQVWPALTTRDTKAQLPEASNSSSCVCLPVGLLHLCVSSCACPLKTCRALWSSEHIPCTQGCLGEDLK